MHFVSSRFALDWGVMTESVLCGKFAFKTVFLLYCAC